MDRKENAMRILKVALPVVVGLAGLVLTSVNSSAKPEYAKKESKSCTFCHVKAGSKDLNDAGKFYKEHKSLDGYKK
jgi:hypothetical protein